MREEQSLRCERFVKQVGFVSRDDTVRELRRLRVENQQRKMVQVMGRRESQIKTPG